MDNQTGHRESGPNRMPFLLGVVLAILLVLGLMLLIGGLVL